MNMSMFVILDVVVGVLGLYLIISGIKNYRAKEVDSMVVTLEEMSKCSDVSGLSKYLMPKEIMFGGFCVLFGIQGLINDGGYFEFSQTINFIFLIAFVVVWIVFSYFIRKAKKLYIH
ncbi:MAG: hypothetical protein K6E79_09290 [Pseudobutyrivibrio sp.]|nr:hypothetical protein [Pseudobutyrivibrio sp.]